jgi:hypothetical protein
MKEERKENREKGMFFRSAGQPVSKVSKQEDPILFS